MYLPQFRTFALHITVQVLRDYLKLIANACEQNRYMPLLCIALSGH